MGEIEQGFIPLGEWKPDLRLLQNDGLIRAMNVVPVHGSYIVAPYSHQQAPVVLDGQPFGLHIHKVDGAGYAAVNVPGAPSRVHLYQINYGSSTATDRSRAATYQLLNDFYGCSFGPYVVMTNYDDEVQYRDGGAAVNFADAITSTFAPKAKFCFPFGDNLFLANCNLPAGYDGLSAGANPTLVAWSRNGDLRQFGSYNANPEISGAGYQPLNYDIGEITGAISADGYAIVMFSDGLVRVEGPSYSFRVVTSECGSIHPYSLIRAKGDIWFWGPSGLTRLRGGDGQPETVGDLKFRRSILDNTTGFFEGAWLSGVKISMAYDAVNDLIIAAYRSNLAPSGWAQTYLCYNVSEDRATYCTSPIVSDGTIYPINFLRSGRNTETGDPWGVFSQVRFMSQVGTVASYRKFVLEELLPENPVVLQKSYMQFKRYRTSRIKRIRPVYSSTVAEANNKFVLTIESTNEPHSTTPIVKGPYTDRDAHGWIVTADTVFADMHSVKLTMTPNPVMHKVVEFKGYEYEVEIGGAYAA